MNTKVKVNKDGGLRYNNVRFDKTPTDKFTEMVTVTKAPKRLKSLEGRKFINVSKAVLAVDVESFSNLLNKRRVDIEMMNYGIVPMD